MCTAKITVANCIVTRPYTPVAGSWAGAVMICAGAVMLWTGACSNTNFLTLKMLKKAKKKTKFHGRT